MYEDSSDDEALDLDTLPPPPPPPARRDVSTPNPGTSHPSRWEANGRETEEGAQASLRSEVFSLCQGLVAGTLLGRDSSDDEALDLETILPPPAPPTRRDVSSIT